MGVRDRLLAGLARQLGHPAGVAGRVVGTALNRGNRAIVGAAVEAADPRSGAVAADVGFGGGAGLGLLLERVGPAGRVHGVEISSDMLVGARRRYRDEVAGGRLELHVASMSALPFADGALDALITVNTIYFVADLAPAFAQLARVLGPSGRAVVGIGDPDAMGAMPFTAHGFRLRPVDEVIAALATAGLEVVEHRRGGEGRRRFHVLAAAAPAGAAR